MATDVAMDDMDIDFDMDGEEDPEIARLQAEAAAINASAEAQPTETMNGVEEAKEEGEYDPNETQSTKLHARGLDKLNTLQVEQWVGEHVPIDLFRKVEWVDDTSANLIFDTEVAAADALTALSSVETFEPLQERRTKELSTHPDQDLRVRQALVTDVKARGAKDRSAFYLYHPEWDPDNPKNVRYGNRKRRFADEEGLERSKYRRRDWQDDRVHRRGSRDQEFTEDMYDEGSGTTSAAASAPPDDRRRASAGSEYSRRKVTFDDDLFASKQSGRLRDRSASPGKDGDGRFGFSDDQPRRRTARPRSSTPPAIRRNRINRENGEKMRRELFPDRPPASALANGSSYDRPVTPPSANHPRELLPDKGTPNHRRQDGRDLQLEEVVHFMGDHNISGGRDPERRNHKAQRPDSRQAPSGPSRGGRGGDLFERVNGRAASLEFGRLNRDGGEDRGISIKGTAKTSNGAGDVEYSFLGASKAGEQKKESSLVKELFPVKIGGGGRRDLFDGRIKGRASGRRRAEDLF